MKIEVEVKTLLVEILPKTHYNPPRLKLSGNFGEIAFDISDDHLAMITDTIHEHFVETGHSDHPDNQQILNAEHEGYVSRSIDEKMREIGMSQKDFL